ncbi:MAG: glycosyltransferase family 39 protein, partial [Holophagales bacterium]|nr:glycosyltransferase family 39 protein [Holophagales bacterium]
ATFRRWREDLGEIRRRLRAVSRRRSKRSLTVLASAAAGFLLTAGGLLMLALYPRLDFDETLYHLPFSRAMLETGELPYLPHLRYPVFPILQEALWTPLLATLGQSGPSALVAAQTAWVGLLLGYWAGDRLGFGYGLSAAGLWLGCPIGWWTGTQAMVDVGLALCTTVAAFCVDRWESSRQHRWLVLAGVAAGGGAAIKYHGLLVLGLVVAAVLLGSGLGRRLVASARLLASAALVVLPVYGWITASTANPVFPFAAGTFGVSEWSQHTRQTGGPEVAARADMGTVFSVRLKGALQKLDQVPETLGRLAIPGRLENAPAPLSVWLVLLAPAGLLALRGPPWRRPRRWALLFLLYFLIWFASSQDSRYLYSALPLLIPLYVTGLAVVARSLPGRRGVAAVAGVMPLLLVLPGFAFAAGELARLGALPTSGSAREAFLHEHRPGYTALRNAEAHWAALHADGRSPRIFTLFGADLQYFARAPLHGDWYGPDRFSRFGDFRQPSIVERLRAEGFDYVLEVHRRTPATLRPFPGLKLLYRDERSALWQIAP